MECKSCGAFIPLRAKGQTGRQREFCNRSCHSDYVNGKFISRVCVGCRLVFSVRSRNTMQIYCTRECGQKFRRKKPDTEVVCLKCVQVFVTSRKNAKFCSAACRYEFARDSYVPAVPKDVYVYGCDWCQFEIVRSTPLGGVKKYHPECAEKAKTARYRLKTVRRQSMTNSALRLCHDDLVARDGLNCYLCGKEIDLSLPRTSKFGATIDHVTPLSKGGLDVLDNLRLTHWICNNRKGSKTLNEMSANA